VLASGILDNLKILSSRDLLDTTINWKDAPIVVSENVTRMAINEAKALMFSQVTGDPVLAWINTPDPSTLRCFENQAIKRGIPVNDLLKQHPELVAYFVRGAPAIITGNIAPDKKVANGTRCNLHSLILEDDEIWDEAIQRYSPGKVTWLDRPPKFIAVKLLDKEKMIQAGWDSCNTLVPGEIVIPLAENRRRAIPFEASSVKKPRLKSKASDTALQQQMAYYDFRVELAFAITYWKIQGQTVRRPSGIILDLRGGAGVARMTVASLYIGISRVETRDQIRILPISTEEKDGLKQLEFDAELLSWLDLEGSKNSTVVDERVPKCELNKEMATNRKRTSSKH
jgi:hypothetical protein